MILNPAAGGGSDAGVLRAVLEARGMVLRVSGGPGEVRRMAREAAEDGVAVVVAAGGDGTVSEVVNGVLDARDPASFGILPLGTGNDFAHGLGIPSRLGPALAVLESGCERPVDVVRYRTVPGGEALGSGAPGGVSVLANAAVLGFCGRIAERLPPATRRRWGRLSYLRAAVGELRDAVPYAVRIRVDGKPITAEASMVIVANGRFAGGRLPLAARARPDDGLLDVVVLPPLDARRFIAILPRVLAGRHLEHPAVRHRTGCVVSVESDPPMWMNLDGETRPPGRITFEVVPRALSVIAP